MRIEQVEQVEGAEVCGHGVPLQSPNGEFVECEACDEGNAEADSFRNEGGEYGGGSM